jgi:hypothetical protein
MMFVSNLFAQEATLSIKDEAGNDEITVAPGQELFYLVFWLDTEYTGFAPDLTARLYMPEGIEVITNEDEEDEEKRPKPILMDRMGTTSMASGYNVMTSYVTVFANHSGAKKMAAGSSGIVKVACRVTTATVSEDPYVIQVKKAKLFDALADDGEGGKGVDFKVPDFSVNVYVRDKVTITLDHEYITYCSDKPLDFSDSELGLTPLVVTDVTATEAEVAGLDKVAAYEGIIINGTPGTYTIPVVTGSTPSKYSGNKLIGVTEETEIAQNSYVLSDGAFRPCNQGKLPANKAYLPESAFTSGAKVITLVFGGTTGINEVQKSETDGAIYNLSGMRVSKTQKGVYIMNGRKVIVK